MIKNRFDFARKTKSFSIVLSKQQTISTQKLSNIQKDSFVIVETHKNILKYGAV